MVLLRVRSLSATKYAKLRTRPRRSAEQVEGRDGGHFEEAQQKSAAQHRITELLQTVEVQHAYLEDLEDMHTRLQGEVQDVAELQEAFGACEEASQRLEAQSLEFAELRETLESEADCYRSWEAQQQEVFRLREALEVQAAELELLRAENQRLHAENQAQAAGADTARHDRERLLALERENGRLHDSLRQHTAELQAFPGENQRLQSQEKELTELREALKLQRLTVSAQQYELTELRAFLGEKALLPAGAATHSPPQSQCLEVERGATRCGPTHQRPREPASAPPVQEAAAEQAELRAQPFGWSGLVSEAQQAACIATQQCQRQQPLPPAQARDRGVNLDLCAQQPKLSGLSEVRDEAIGQDSEAARQRRLSEVSELSELSELRSASEAQTALISALRHENRRLDSQEEEISELRKALELQTTNVDTLLREGRRLQALEGELADFHAASEAQEEAQDLGQRSRSSATVSSATEEAWSLTSPSGSSPAGGPGFESVTISSPPSTCQQPVAVDRDPAGPAAVPSSVGSGRRWSGHQQVEAWADIEDPWRLVRAILGVLDAMQQKLGTCAERACCPQTCGERWRSVISVDIRILVGVGSAAAGCWWEDAREDAGRTFMYVLI